MGLNLHDHIRRLDGLVPCHTCDPNLFFDESASSVKEAKSLCRACPLRRSCLAEALARGESRGVWGGERLHNGKVTSSRLRRPRSLSR